MSSSWVRKSTEIALYLQNRDVNNKTFLPFSHRLHMPGISEVVNATTLLRGLPSMTSALEGGGGSEKVDNSTD